MKKRCVIVGGAPIENYEWVRSHLRQDDFVIYCDCGLKHRDPLNAPADLIVGDFDSFPEPETAIDKIVLPREKDDTDTVYAVKTALQRGFEDFLLIGGVGARLDHTLGNVSILLYLHSLKKRVIMVDDFSEMEIISDKTAYVSDRFAYFSLLNITGLAKRVTIKNAKYSLENAEITCEYAYGISNEVLPGRAAEITVGEGRLLLIRVAND